MPGDLSFSMEYTAFLSSSFVNIPSQDAQASSDKLGKQPLRKLACTFSSHCCAENNDL